MLKIRDGVDLKELEKYGYYLASMYGQPAYIKDLKYNDNLAVIIDTRRLFLDSYEYSYKYLLEEIDDLIKADMVERIDE